MAWLPKITNPGLKIGSGDLFGPYTAVAVGAGLRVTLPPGLMYVITDANTTVQITTDGGTTFVTVCAISSGGMIVSDGTNLSADSASVAGTVHYVMIG